MVAKKLSKEDCNRIEELVKQLKKLSEI